LSLHWCLQSCDSIVGRSQIESFHSYSQVLTGVCVGYPSVWNIRSGVTGCKGHVRRMRSFRRLLSLVDESIHAPPNIQKLLS
jgi:hypothetical protein